MRLSDASDGFHGSGDGGARPFPRRMLSRNSRRRRHGMRRKARGWHEQLLCRVRELEVATLERLEREREHENIAIRKREKETEGKNR